MIEFKSTIGEIKTRNLWLEVRCRKCSHAALIPARMLSDRLADDLPSELAAAHFRCSACNSRDVVSHMADALMR